MKGPYTGNHKTLQKETEDDINGKTSCAHGLDDFVLLKCYTIQSNLQFKYNPYQQLECYFFFRNRKIQPIIHVKSKGLGKTKTILKKRAKLRGLTVPDFRTYSKLQSSKQSGTGMKTDTQTNRVPRNINLAYMVK